jgi:hypothetical protein
MKDQESEQLRRAQREADTTAQYEAEKVARSERRAAVIAAEKHTLSNALKADWDGLKGFFRNGASTIKNVFDPPPTNKSLTKSEEKLSERLSSGKISQDEYDEKKAKLHSQKIDLQIAEDAKKYDPHNQIEAYNAFERKKHDPAVRKDSANKPINEAAEIKAILEIMGGISPKAAQFLGRPGAKPRGASSQKEGTDEHSLKTPDPTPNARTESSRGKG